MNRLSLFLQNSSGQLTVGVASDDTLLFDSGQDETLATSRDILAHLSAARAGIGQDIDSISEVFVDVGPGGLGSTRTTAAFANALGYAKGIPVIGINAFALIGFHAARNTDKPVICIRHAARPHFYVGRYQAGQLHDFAFLEKDTVLGWIERYKDTAVFAGKYKFGSDDADTIPISVANAASMQSFLLCARNVAMAKQQTTRVYPITENLEGV